MRIGKTSLLFLIVVTTFFAHAAVMPSQAEAGPLMDWLFRRCQSKHSQQPAATACQTCTQTCSRVVASYVPYTAYRTCYEQVPVTYYRQVTNTDPCTGCTITCNRPCTTYQLQAKRVPYTAYRTVYRTETTQTPVTQAYSPGSACSACSSCATGAGTQPQPYGYTNQTVQPYGYSNVAPATYSQVQPYGNSTTGVYGANPADAQPTLAPGNFSPSTITNYPPYNDASSYSTPDYNPSEYSYPATDDTRIETRSVIKSGDEEPSQEEKANGIQLNSPSGQGAAQNGDGGKQTSTRRRAVTPYVDPNSQWRTEPQPAPNGKTASSPIRRNWNYSPRLASYQPPRTSASTDRMQQNTVQYTAQPTRDYNSVRQPQTRAMNEGWRSGN